MAKAANTRALSTLDRIYRFAGGRTPAEVDVERPVQLVHDVGPNASRLAQQFLWFRHQFTSDSSGNPTYDDIGLADIYGFLGEQWQFPLNETEFWLLDLVAFVTEGTAANFERAVAMLVPPIADLGTAVAMNEVQAMPIQFWNASSADKANNATAYEALVRRTSDNNVGYAISLPRKVGELYYSITDGGVAGATVHFRHFFCVTPKGIAPGPPIRPGAS